MPAEIARFIDIRYIVHVVRHPVEIQLYIVVKHRCTVHVITPDIKIAFGIAETGALHRAVYTIRPVGYDLVLNFVYGQLVLKEAVHADSCPTVTGSDSVD